MQVDLIETFLDLMETRSFNRTAERLNITQSTVLHRVKALETQSTASSSPATRAEPFRRPRDCAFSIMQSLANQWHEATRAVASAGRLLERSMRLGIQHDLARDHCRPLGRCDPPRPCRPPIYMEADYSNQMNAIFAAGELDLAILYTPISARPSL